MKFNVPGCPWEVWGTPTTRASTATAKSIPIEKGFSHFK